MAFHRWWFSGALVLCASGSALGCGSGDSRSTSANVSASQSAAAVSAGVIPTLKAGDVAPAFELQGSDGKVHKLSEHAGHEAVVVAWFPKAFTGG